MAKDVKGSLEPMLINLRQMYNAANFGANASTLTVTQLRTLVDQIHGSFNGAKSAWLGLVAGMGSVQAREALAQRISPTPADVDASLSSVQTDCLAVLNAYKNSTYANPGAAAWTYSADLVGGLIEGGHTEEMVTVGTINALNGLCNTLRTSLLALAPVE